MVSAEINVYVFCNKMFDQRHISQLELHLWQVRQVIYLLYKHGLKC